ncbi:hypothetical protein [Bauldia sp.]|uniref:hypothetical protein n=1 Tax=Bauldia sp. TaxID=2575872 RepID=UPI003BAD5454
MHSSLETLQQVQIARATALPQTEPGSNGYWLEGVRRRNAALDAVFYDVGVISDGEARAISPWLAREGAILYVPPSGKGDVRVCSGADDLVKTKPAAKSLAVAGVGSSALGSAAFARNVADATGAPVAAVVSGYGLSDLASEALGGWFLFGYANRSRDPCEAGSGSSIGAVATDRLTRTSKDTEAVIALLRDKRLSFDLLTGHSKGNLVLSEALFAISDDSRPPVAADTRIVTISAAIYLPDRFTNIVDVMGEWDSFGRLNSSRCLSIDVTVPAALHHTNTQIPGHIPVTETLAGVLAG